MSGDQTSVMSSGMLTNRLRSESPVTDTGLLDSPAQTLATAAPGYRGGVYVINVSYSRKLRRVAPPFSLMLYIVNYLYGCKINISVSIGGMMSLEREFQKGRHSAGICLWGNGERTSHCGLTSSARIRYFPHRKLR